MAPVLNINVFKCIMPLGLSEIIGDLANNMKYGIYQIGNKAFLSVYKMNKDTYQGYLADNTQCNLQLINEASQTKNTPLEAVFNGCKDKNAIYEIVDLIINFGNKHNIILKQAVMPNNGTANILGQDYIINGNMFSQGNITETNGADFLGLNECTKEEAMSVLQKYSTYKKQLTSIETLTNILQDTLNHLGISQDNAQEAGVKIFDVLNIPVKFTTDNLKVILEAFNVTLDDISPTEVGKNVLYLLSKPFTDPTTTTTETPNKDTNDGGSWGYVIGAIGWLVALGIAGKYGWDWYKGRTIKNENLELVSKNKELAFVELLHENLKNNAVILDKIVKIHDLDDVIRLARSNEEYQSLIPQINNLNNEIVKLHSPSAIVMNLDSSSGILHEICKSLGSYDNLETISNFATLIATTRTANTKSEEYKESIIKIFNLFDPNYTDIEYQQDYAMPLLADGSPSSGFSSNHE